MKKNKMMRLACSLLVAVLLTSSVISGTFAKYVTSDEATDTARVAKWGVTVTADGSLFAKTYKKGTDTCVPGADTDTDEGVLTVVSSTDSAVIAPGTKSDDKGLTLAVAGKPEVDVKVTVSVTTANDVYVDGYYPIKYTLTQTNETGPNTLVNKGSLADVQNALIAVTTVDGTIYHANQNLADKVGTLRLTWEWEFGDPANNVNDTKLGNLAAGQTVDDVTDYNLNAKVDFKITVEQVD